MTLSKAIAKLLAGALAIAPVGNVQAQAEAINLFTPWQIEPAAPPQAALDLAGGDFVIKQRLLPMGLAQLDTPLVDPARKLSLAAGTQLVAVGEAGKGVFCDATRYKKKANDTVLACFVDADRDGRFESYFKGYSYSGAIISLQGKVKAKNLKPIAPVAYRTLAPDAFTQDLFVGIQRRNYFNIYSRESFMVVFGNAQHTEEITQPIQFKSAEMPKDMTVLGARFTALSETAGRMRIKVHSAMPQQPFAIYQTTTYRFY